MSNKIWAALCAVLGLATAVFAVLTVMNIKNPSQAEAPAAKAEYKLEDGIPADALADELAGLIPSNMKSASYPDGILESMKPLYAANKNTVGRLTIPGTEMDTAVVQAKDNSKYLSVDFYERQTYETSSLNYGNIYLDYRCSHTDSLSKNMVIHGHTTGKSDGVPKQAFRSLYDYRDKKTFIKSPIIRYSTLYGEHTYKICAVFYSTTQPSADNGYFFNYIYPDMSDSNMVGYIEQVKQRMLYDTGVSLEPTDKVLTLSTCIYDYGKHIDTRLVVLARLLHDGEDESIDTSAVKDNPDYRRPQVWYSSNGKTNPYKNAARWEPSPN